MNKAAEHRPTFSTGRRLGIGFHVVLSCAALVAIVAMLNYLGARHFVRADWSPGGRLELSPLTRHVLATVTNEVQVVVFFDPDEPIYSAVTALLKEYELACPKIRVRALDYYRNPTGADQFKTGYKLAPAARDLVLFDHQGRTRVVHASELSDYDISPLLAGRSREIRRTAFKGEVLFTSAISSVIAESQPKAYFLEGHQEMDIADPQGPLGFGEFARLMRLNNVESAKVSLLGTNDIPSDCQLLVIAGPQTRLNRTELEKLDRYLGQGGRLLVLFHSFHNSGETGLEKLLANWGVAVGNDLARDLQMSLASERPDFVATNYGAHEITRALVDLPLTLFGPRSVSRRADLPLKAEAPNVTELLKTTGAGIAHTDIRRDGVHPRPGDWRGEVPLAVAVEKGALPGVKLDRGATRIVAVGEVKFLGNEWINQFGNRHFAEKSIHWLLDRSHLLAAIPPAPVRESKFILTERQMLAVRWIVIGAMPGSVLAFGLLVWFRRRH